MTRILMFDNEMPPLGGGMGTVNLALLQQLKLSSEIEIDLITSAIDGRYECDQFSERIRIYKVPVWNQNIHHSTNRELIFYFFQALLLGIYLQIKKPYQLSFAWSTVPAGAISRIIQIVFRLHYIVFVSGPDIPGFEHRYQSIYIMLNPLIKNVWRHAAHVIAKCLEEVEMMKRTVRDVDVRIIPNGVDISVYFPQDKKTDRSSFEVLCVARLIERKGQHHLIQAARILANEGIDIQVNLIGTGDLIDYYKDLSKSLRIQDRIHFLGYVSREETPKYYQSADVFVLPSFSEGMSLAALEAAASGLPLILTQTGGTGQMVENGINGFIIDWADIDSLTNHLRILAYNRIITRKMGVASRQIAEQFDWQKIVIQYLELINNITPVNYQFNSKQTGFRS